MKTLSRLALIACALALVACGRQPSDATTDADAAAAQAGPTEARTALGRTVARALDEARAKLAQENIALNGNVNININGRRIGARHSDLPRAEITPAGDLLIEGTAVPMDAAARDLALDYRANLIAIIGAGMDLGVQGADLGMKAASEAIGGIFSGNFDDMEQRIEAEAAKIEAAAIQLCERLPALLVAQDALAAAVPEFKPYARMEQSDIDDCGTDSRLSRTRTAADEADAAARADEAAAEADAADAR